MHRSFVSLLLIAPLLLAGCAGQPPKQDPAKVYSNAEVKAFALKMLSASKMQSDLYARYRRALTEPQQNDASGI